MTLSYHIRPSTPQSIPPIPAEAGGRYSPALAFEWIGPSAPTRRVYTVAEVGIVHAVYDQMLDCLEDRRVHSASGEVVNSQFDASLIDVVSHHPRWKVSKAAPYALLKQLQLAGQEDLLFDHRIVAVPGSVENALLCDQLRLVFSESDLLSVPGFTLKGDPPVLRIDLDPYLSRAGFIIPVIQNRLIKSLRVFKHPNDRRPFILRSREEVALHG